MFRPSSLLVTILLAAPTAEAQSPPAPPTAVPTAPPTAAVQAEPPDAAQPQGFSYHPEGRRDPFVSLLRRGAELERDPASARPPGLPGMATSEVVLSGIMASKGGYVAMLRGADKKTYIVRSGDRLYDGTVRSITADTMVILQQVNDPLSLEKQREVRKVLRQDEAN